MKQLSLLDDPVFSEGPLVFSAVSVFSVAGGGF